MASDKTFNFSKTNQLRVYERTANNQFKQLVTVVDEEAWQAIGQPLKDAGKELVLVRGEIIDATYTESKEEVT